MNTLAEDNSMHAGYSDVYDWRPSVEKTDVMRTMEAIEGKSRNIKTKILPPMMELTFPHSVWKNPKERQ